MAQSTNLNVSPYFDDFDADNNYYKVLFKPGYPVQARELTQVQSILQNQIKRSAQYFLEDGEYDVVPEFIKPIFFSATKSNISL